jgi:DNA topoisomerase-2
LFGCFKKKLKGEIKVAQLTGYIGQHTAYHHGEVSLQSTIVGMAQNFVGSNNINLLSPNGAFGTRAAGPSKFAQARYIFTAVPPITRALFHVDDDPILTYLDDDGLSIEPEYYVPVLPMVLVNGNEGIGTGWSSSVPNYNPADIIDNLERMIKGEPIEPMHPWFRGFTGSITWDTSKSNYRVKGVWNRIDDETLEITELPVQVWTEKYKKFLESSLEGAEAPAKKKKKDDDDDDDAKVPAQPSLIESYKEYHTTTKVHFVIKCAKLAKMSDDEVEKKFKLTTTIAVSNMHLFDPQGRIKKYNKPEEILEEFYHVRLAHYQKRKDHQVAQLERDWKMLENKVRFLLAVIAKEIVVSNRKKVDLLAELVAKKFDAFPKQTKKVKTAADDDDEEAENAEEEEDEEDKKDAAAAERSRGYDYLLSMALWSLTMERVNKLKQLLAEKKRELEELLETKPTDLWKRDLTVARAQWEVRCFILGTLCSDHSAHK